MTLVTVLGVAYLAFLTFTLALLAAGKRADDSATRQFQDMSDSVQALPSLDALGRVAAEVREALGAERVAVVLSDPDEPTTGVVGACLGAPGLLGSRVPVGPTRATGVLQAQQASVLGLPRELGSDAWRFAHVPIAGTGNVIGAVTAASRSHTFAQADLRLIEHVARGGSGLFDRRARARREVGG